MQIDDALLMAYADDELDAATRAQLQPAIEADPRLAERVRRQRALRAQLRAAFEPELAEPVPQRLLDAVQQPATADDARVVDLAVARGRRESSTTRRRWAGLEWGAMAACLLVGVLAGSFIESSGRQGAFEDGAAGLVAAGPLAEALSDRVAGGVSEDGKVTVPLSFRSASGDYCRAFALDGETALAGLACRAGGAWQVQVLTRAAASAPGAAYRQAGSALPAAVLAAVDERIAGAPLDAAAEQAAKARAWQP